MLRFHLLLVVSFFVWTLAPNGEDVELDTECLIIKMVGKFGVNH